MVGDGAQGKHIKMFTHDPDSDHGDRTVDAGTSRRENLNERYFVIFLAFLSLTSFYPVIYVLINVHKKRGFDIVLTIAAVVATLFYKVTVAFDLEQIFIT